MSVHKYKTKRGISWFYKAYFIDYQGKRKQKTKRGFMTRKEAKEAEAKFLLERKNDCSVPFSIMCDRYIATCELKDKRPMTIEYNKHIISHFLLPYFKDTPVHDIR